MAVDGRAASVHAIEKSRENADRTKVPSCRQFPAVIAGGFVKASAGEYRFTGVFVVSDISVSKDEAFENHRKAVKPVIENCGSS